MQSQTSAANGTKKAGALSRPGFLMRLDGLSWPFE
jgi:hypothetical protein